MPAEGCVNKAEPAPSLPYGRVRVNSHIDYGARRTRSLEPGLALALGSSSVGADPGARSRISQVLMESGP